MNFKYSMISPFGVLIEPVDSKGSVEDIEIGSLREWFHGEHLLVLRGFRNFEDSESFARYCELWGEISVWPFGKVLELVEQDDPQDHIFDHNYVPLHWDGMYRPQVPEVQIFHCVRAPLKGCGGRTTFSNTVLALKKVDSELRDLWERVTGVYQRKMEYYDSKTVSPVVTRHPYLDYSVIRYNEPAKSTEAKFVNPPDLEFNGLVCGEGELFHQGLSNALYDPANFYAHEWQTGDVVIADNFSLLHGREAFISKSPRHLRRVHVLSNPPFNNPGLMNYR